MIETPAGLLEEARAALEPVSALALRAGSADLENCRPHLERALGLLEAALAGMRQPAGTGPAVDRPLERFRHELRRATALHEHAAGFYLGWMRVLAGSSGAGYSPREGDALPMLVHSGRRMSLIA